MSYITKWTAEQYEQRIRELEAELAAAQTWQPVVLGDKPIVLSGPFRTVVSMMTSDVLAIVKPGPDNRALEAMLVHLTNDLRLCRRADAAPRGLPVQPAPQGECHQ